MNDRWISVRASGDAAMTPDTAVITFAVSAEGTDLRPARDDVNRRSSAVLAALREGGLGDADLEAPDIGIEPQYDYRRGQKLTGYRVSRHMSARVRNLDHLGETLDRIVAAGANEVQGARMTASQPAAAEHQALEAAVRAARQKAEAVAAAAGVTLGRLARLEEEAGWAGPPEPMFRAMAAMPEATGEPTEVVTGELTVTRHVRAWFAID